MIDPDLLVQAVQAAKYGVYICDPRGQFLYVNPGFAKISGYSEKELIGHPISMLASGAMSPDYYERLWGTITRGQRWQEEITNRRKDGELYTALQIITPVYCGGEISAYIGVQHPMTTTEPHAVAADTETTEFEAIFSNAPDTLFLVDVAERSFQYRTISGKYQQLTGRKPDALVGRSPTEVFGPADGAYHEARFNSCVETAATVTYEETISTPQGERVIETRLSPILRDTTVVQLIGSSRDVTERKNFERELRYLSDMDMLTNIANRRVISEELERELSRAQRHGRPLSVLLVDVDRFKSVNDDLGHEAGDAALRGLAATLHAALRPSDRVGRWGGEEFVAILAETDHEGAQIAAERIRTAVENSTILPDRILTVSIGIASMAPVDRSNSSGLAHSPESLLRVADEELYRAKESGRNRIFG